MGKNNNNPHFPTKRKKTGERQCFAPLRSANPSCPASQVTGWGASDLLVVSLLWCLLVVVIVVVSKMFKEVWSRLGLRLGAQWPRDRAVTTTDLDSVELSLLFYPPPPPHLPS